MLQDFVVNASSVFSGVCYKYVYLCCICFTQMLQVFYLDVAYVLQWFASVSDACFKYFICLETLQVLYLDISKVDQVLHLPSRFLCLASVSPPPPPPPTPDGHPLPLTSLLDAGDVRGGSGPAWAHKMVRETDASACVLMPRLSGR
jgi:hypothetical protein